MLSIKRKYATAYPINNLDPATKSAKYSIPNISQINPMPVMMQTPPTTAVKTPENKECEIIDQTCSTSTCTVINSQSAAETIVPINTDLSNLTSCENTVPVEDNAILSTEDSLLQHAATSQTNFPKANQETEMAHFSNDDQQTCINFTSIPFLPPFHINQISSQESSFKIRTNVVESGSMHDTIDSIPDELPTNLPQNLSISKQFTASDRILASPEIDSPEINDDPLGIDSIFIGLKNISLNDNSSAITKS